MINSYSTWPPSLLAMAFNLFGAEAQILRISFALAQHIPILLEIGVSHKLKVGPNPFVEDFHLCVYSDLYVYSSIEEFPSVRFFPPLLLFCTSE